MKLNVVEKEDNKEVFSIDANGWKKKDLVLAMDEMMKEVIADYREKSGDYETPDEVLYSIK